MNTNGQRLTKDLDILMATQRDRFTDNPFRDDGPLATLEKTISFIATLEAERDAALAEVEKLRGDSDLLDWLQENFYNRENVDWITGKVSKTTSMWVFFAPIGVQGNIREVLKAAQAAQGKTP